MIRQLHPFVSPYAPKSHILMQVLREGYKCHKFVNGYILYYDFLLGKYRIIPSFKSGIFNYPKKQHKKTGTMLLPCKRRGKFVQKDIAIETS
ncbi:hypothetical protein HanRHA438_Chr06g0272971 [Helianthus annuus]|nr:hypothetical protein HanIR_Chr06g0283571 [Helianthus annuus]KAJ0912326.1 hypothetical protein HanRHA438_Chr06g0272971 [Helianthus annuus]